MKQHPLGAKRWAALLIFGLFGQLAWTIENMYFNVFVYNTISTDPGVIANMVAASAITATLTTLIMGLYTIARWLAGRLDSVRRATFDNTMLFWFYTVGQGLVGLLVVHGFPRLSGGL